MRGSWRLAIAGAVCALALACVGGTEVAQETPAPETAAPRIAIMPLGRAARTDAAEMTVHRVRGSLEEGGETAPSGREWLLVEVTVKNTSMEGVDLLIRFRDRDGADLERAHPPGADAFDAAVGPGEVVRGEVAFVAPAGMVGGTVIYGPGEERWAIQLGMYPIER